MSYQTVEIVVNGLDLIVRKEGTSWGVDSDFLGNRGDYHAFIDTTNEYVGLVWHRDGKWSGVQLKKNFGPFARETTLLRHMVKWELGLQSRRVKTPAPLPIEAPAPLDIDAPIDLEALIGGLDIDVERIERECPACGARIWHGDLIHEAMGRKWHASCVEALARKHETPAGRFDATTNTVDTPAPIEEEELTLYRCADCSTFAGRDIECVKSWLHVKNQEKYPSLCCHCDTPLDLGAVSIKSGFCRPCHKHFYGVEVPAWEPTPAPDFATTEALARIDGMHFGTFQTPLLALPLFASTGPRYRPLKLQYGRYGNAWGVFDTFDNVVEDYCVEECHALQIASSRNYWEGLEVIRP